MRHIAHFTTVSMKYFFDIDAHMFAQAFAFILVALYTIRIFPCIVAYEFHEGIITIKEDLNEIKETIISFKERWDNSEVHEVLANFRLPERFNH